MNNISASRMATSTGLFFKQNDAAPLIFKTSATTVSIKAGSKIEVFDIILTFNGNVPAEMPAQMVPGTNYYVYIGFNSTIAVSSNKYGIPNTASKLIGGFHFGFNNEINEYSIWDLKWRPKCEPEGMTCVNNSFWTDIYLTNKQHINGTSLPNEPIATGSNPPRIPTTYDINNQGYYAGLNWYNAIELLNSHKKRLPTYSEFILSSFGTDENISSSTPSITGLSSGKTSKWGVEQANGCLWIWGNEFIDANNLSVSTQQDTITNEITSELNSTSEWFDTTRGKSYNQPLVAVFGGSGNTGTNSGSRAAYWGFLPTHSAADIGIRGYCDHKSN